MGAGSRAAIAAVAVDASPGHRGDDASGRIHSTDAVVELVDDEEVVVEVEPHSAGPTQVGARSGATVAAKASDADAGHRGDDASDCIDAANAAIIEVGDEEVVVRVERHCRREVQGGAGGRTAVTAKAL